MTAEIHSLPSAKLEREIELLQECGKHLVGFGQHVGRLMESHPDSKNLRALANRVCRTSMWLDREWGRLLDQRSEMKRDPLPRDPKAAPTWAPDDRDLVS